jgi:hypothetical protein
MTNDASGQSFKTHAKYVPLFHFFGLPVLIMNAVSCLLAAFRRPAWETVMAALVGVALVVLFVYVRSFALRVQDRVIRLEMRLRLRELLPADLQPRIAEFTIAQLVSLRFASDRELPALARRVLDERLEDRKAIKRLITDWQADNQRA